MLNNWRMKSILFLVMIAFIYAAVFYSWKFILLVLGSMLIVRWLWYHPSYGISLSIFLAGLGVLSFFTISTIHIRTYQLIMLMTFGTLVIKNLWLKTQLSLPRPLFYVVCFFIFSLIFSFINAPYPAVFMKQFFLLTVYMLFFITIINVVRTPAHLRLMKNAIIFSGALACLYSFLVILHIAPSAGGASLYHFARPQSFFAEPNEFGVFLVFVGGFTATYFLTAEGISQKIWAGIVGLMIIANIIPNMSRGSWIGLLVAVFVALILLRSFKVKKINFLKISGLMVAVVAVILIFAQLMSVLIPSRSSLKVKEIVGERVVSLFQEKDPTRDIRYQSNKAAINAFWEHPFIGQGLGNSFVILEKKYTNKEGQLQELPKIIAATSSNFISDIAIEGGLFGMTAFLGFVFWILRSAFLRMKRIKEKDVLVISIGAIASFAGIVVNGLTYAMHMLPFFWVTAGILSVEIEKQ